MFTWQKNNTEIKPGEHQIIFSYLAEIGRVGFATVLAITLIGVVAEFSYRGLMFNHFSPQRMISLIIFFAALSLLDPVERKLTWWRMLFFILSMLVLGAILIIWSWNYFAPLLDRTLLTIAIAFILFTVLIGIVRFLHSDLRN